MQLCVLHSHMRAAAACAGGVWQEQSSPGGTGDCHVDMSTPGLKRPEQIHKNEMIK